MKNKIARLPLTVLAALLPLTTTAAFAASTAPTTQNRAAPSQSAPNQQGQHQSGPRDGMRGGPRDGQGGPRAAIETAVAKALGLSADALHQQLRSGKTLAEIAKAGGVSTATLRTAALNALKTALAADVKAGKLTQAQADQMLTRAQADTTFGLGGPGRDGAGRDGGPRGGPDGQGGRDGRGGPDGRPDNDRGPRGALPTDTE